MYRPTRIFVRFIEISRLGRIVEVEEEWSKYSKLFKDEDKTNILIKGIKYYKKSTQRKSKD